MQAHSRSLARFIGYMESAVSGTDRWEHSCVKLAGAQHGLEAMSMFLAFSGSGVTGERIQRGSK